MWEGWKAQKEPFEGVLQIKVVLKNFGKFTGKHLYQYFFLSESTL